MEDTELIRSLYREYWRCMVKKDVNGLRSMMTDDYYLLHMTGVKQSAEAFLKGLLDRTFNYFAAEHDSIEVTVAGDQASMIGKSRVLAAVYGGGKHSWRLRGDFSLRKEEGCWRFSSSRASTY
jgi:ketosteroid isomerase-like protein